MPYNWPLPTILVAGSCPQVGDTVAALQRDGYLVLECRDESEAMNIVRLHSRPIHVMLIDESVYAHDLAARLNLYRPQMRVVFMDWQARQNLSGRVREILESLDGDHRSRETRPAVHRRSA